MSTTTQTPLDAAIQERTEAAIALENAMDYQTWVDSTRYGRLSGPRLTAVLNLRAAAAERVAAAVARYDAAKDALDAETAKRPDLFLCTCGHPECEYRA